MTLENELNIFNKKYHFLLDIINGKTNIEDFDIKIVNNYICNKEINSFIQHCLSSEAKEEYYNLFKTFWYESYLSCATPEAFFQTPIDNFLPFFINNMLYGFLDIKTKTIYYVSNSNELILIEEKRKIEDINNALRQQRQDLYNKTNPSKKSGLLDKLDNLLNREDNIKEILDETSLISKEIIKNDETLAYINNELKKIEQQDSLIKQYFNNFIKVINNKCGLLTIVQIKENSEQLDKKLNENNLNEIVEVYKNENS